MDSYHGGGGVLAAKPVHSGASHAAVGRESAEEASDGPDTVIHHSRAARVHRLLPVP